MRQMTMTALRLLATLALFSLFPARVQGVVILEATIDSHGRVALDTVLHAASPMSRWRASVSRCTPRICSRRPSRFDGRTSGLWWASGPP